MRDVDVSRLDEPPPVNGPRIVPTSLSLARLLADIARQAPTPDVAAARVLELLAAYGCQFSRESPRQ